MRVFRRASLFCRGGRARSRGRSDSHAALEPFQDRMRSLAVERGVGPPARPARGATRIGRQKAFQVRQQRTQSVQLARRKDRLP